MRTGHSIGAALDPAPVLTSIGAGEAMAVQLMVLADLLAVSAAEQARSVHLPDTNSLVGIQPHGVTRLDTEGRVELVDVTADLIRAELIG